jgi:phage gp45-like
MMGHVWNRLRLLVAHGVGTLIGADFVQVKGLEGEVLKNVKRVEPYGLSYMPNGGCQAYMVFPSGDRSYGIALILGDKQYQVVCAAGEVALHDDQGQKIHIKRDGIEIDGAGKPVSIINTPKVRADTERFEVTGDIVDRCDENARSIGDMRGIHDEHTHLVVAVGAQTDPSLQVMGGGSA